MIQLETLGVFSLTYSCCNLPVSTSRVRPIPVSGISRYLPVSVSVQLQPIVSGIGCQNGIGLTQSTRARKGHLEKRSGERNVDSRHSWKKFEAAAHDRAGCRHDDDDEIAYFTVC